VSAGAFGVDLDGLKQAGDGIQGVLDELGTLGFAADAMSGGAVETLGLSADQMGDDALSAAEIDLCGRAHYLVRGLVDQAQDTVDKLRDTRSIYEKVEGGITDFLNRLKEDTFGDPTKSSSAADDGPPAPPAPAGPTPPPRPPTIGIGRLAERPELGKTDDPMLLVPGDSQAILKSAQGLTILGDAMVQAADGMARIDTSSHWSGEAADAFRSYFHDHPAQWAKGAALSTAGAALQPWAEVLVWAQNEAAACIAQYNQGKQATEQAKTQFAAAVDNYNSRVDAANSGGPPPGPVPQWTDPGQADRDAAQHRLDAAYAKLKSAAQTALGTVGQCRDSLPEEPGWLEQMADDFADQSRLMVTEAGSVIEGAFESIEGIAKLLRSVNPVDSYNITHPVDYMHNVQGLGQGLLHAVTHPVDFLKAAVDWDTWSKDPGRAIGHLLPNVAAAAFTGGAAEAGFAAADGVTAGMAGMARAAVPKVLSAFGRDAGETAAQAGGREVAEAATQAATREAATGTAPWHQFPDHAPPPQPHGPVTDYDSYAKYYSTGDPSFGPTGHTPPDAAASPEIPAQHVPDTTTAAIDQHQAAVLEQAGRGLDGVEQKLDALHGVGTHVESYTPHPVEAPPGGPNHAPPDLPSPDVPGPGHRPGDSPDGIPQSRRDPNLYIEEDPKVRDDIAHTAVHPDADPAKLSVDTVWRDSREPLYRVDDRSPAEIFQGQEPVGFAPLNPNNTDLRTYVGWNHESAFVSTTRKPDYWLTERNGGWYYEVDASGGIDVNKTIGPHSYEEEEEIAMLGGIRPERIRGAWPILYDEATRTRSLGEWLPNPNFRPIG
jgi:hypothetical protein